MTSRCWPKESHRTDPQGAVPVAKVKLGSVHSNLYSPFEATIMKGATCMSLGQVLLSCGPRKLEVLSLGDSSLASFKAFGSP